MSEVLVPSNVTLFLLDSEACRNLLHTPRFPFIRYRDNWYLGSKAVADLIGLSQNGIGCATKRFSDEFARLGHVIVNREQFEEISRCEGASGYSFGAMPPVIQEVNLYPAQLIMVMALSARVSPIGVTLRKQFGIQYKHGLAELFLLDMLTHPVSEPVGRSKLDAPAKAIERPVQIVSLPKAPTSSKGLDPRGVYCDASVRFEPPVTRIAAWSAESGVAVVQEFPYVMSVEGAESMALTLGYTTFNSLCLYTDCQFAVGAWTGRYYEDDNHACRPLARIHKNAVIRYIPREENSIADALTRVLNAPDGPFALTKSTSGTWVVPCFLKKKSRGSGDLDLCIEKTEEAIQKVDDLLAELQDRLSQAVAKKKTLEEELVQLNASQEILNRTLGRSNIISIKKAS